MTNSLFIDISSFQPSNIDWSAYVQWSRSSGDGKSRLCVKSSYGYGYEDMKYRTFISGAISAGIDIIYHYHYAYPQYNSPENEAYWQRQVVGPLDGRPNDMVMLDFEESGAPQSTADWAYRWLTAQKSNYNGRLPLFYSFDSFIRSSLQDQRLAQFPLILANWTFNPSVKPVCPPPWKTFDFLQWTDHATGIPGLPAGTIVDADVYTKVGNSMTIPVGWTDNGSTLRAPNGQPVVLGFRDYVLNHNWDAGNVPLDKEAFGVVLLHRPDLGQMDYQLFQNDLLWYTPKSGVVRESELGLEIQLRNKVIADKAAALVAANAEIANLQAQLASGTSIPPALQAAINAADAKLATLEQEIATLKSQVDPFVK